MSAVRNTALLGRPIGGAEELVDLLDGEVALSAFVQQVFIMP
jgi:hypothetical protein